MNAAAALWDARTAGERRVLLVVGALALAALVFAFAWLPMERQRLRLAQELPALRASLGQMQRQAEEARRLRAMPAVAASPSAPLATLAASGELGRGLAGAQATVLNDKAVAVSGGDVGYGALIEWVSRMQAAHGLRVESARIEALAAPGRVRAELRLARP